MTLITLEDLESDEAMDKALKKILVDWINESDEIQKLDREKTAELGTLQTELIKQCAMRPINKPEDVVAVEDVT